jgi:hypothetical protein
VNENGGVARIMGFSAFLLVASQLARLLCWRLERATDQPGDEHACRGERGEKNLGLLPIPSQRIHPQSTYS